MPKTTPEQNKTIVLEAFDTLFNKRDYDAAERFWSPTYIQHSAHIAPGREGLFDLVRLRQTRSATKINSLSQKAITSCARPFLWKREARSLDRH
jgi:predicted SnoaL-like aldol condensation-catalyzing enzyme